jgi:hypothetical protein
MIGESIFYWNNQVTIWAKSELILVYIGTDQDLIGNITKIMGEPIAASTMNSSNLNLQDNLPMAVIAAIQNLSDLLGILQEDIVVVEYEFVNWSDSCLGYSNLSEQCLQVITPGYRVILESNDQNYEYHTDVSGRSLRLLSGIILDPAKPKLDLNKPNALLVSIQYLSDLLGLPTADLEVESIEQVSWPDSCLGLPEEGEVCVDVIVPGWLIHLVGGEFTYEIHTDLPANNIRLK